jgi:hypothetical protein
MSLSVSLSFIFSDLLIMKNTKTVAVSIVLSDRLEAIAYNIAVTYNIAAMAQIQPSMSEPADVSLPLPSSDLLLMDTKMAAMSTVLSDHLEAIAYNIAATYNIAAMAQIQPSMSEPADVSLLLPSSDLLLMDTKMVAVLTVLSDRLEAITYNIAMTYNIAATAQIQPSMSKPADVSLPLPSSELLLMDTKMAAVSTVVIDDKTIEAIIHNIAAMAQIQPSSMSKFADGADPTPSAARRPGPSSPSVHDRVRRCKLG